MIASDVLKHVKKYFEDNKFADKSQEIKKHAWWALRPDGLAYHAVPTPINIPFDPTSPEYVVSDLCYSIVTVGKYHDRDCFSIRMESSSPSLLFPLRRSSLH
jgi:hypothetical protein